MARSAHPLRYLLLPALLIVAACHSPDQPTKQAQREAAEHVTSAREEIAGVVAPAVERVQLNVAEQVTAPLLDVQEAVQTIAPPSLAPPPPAVDPRAVSHIVRWEVTSEKVYTRKYNGVVCPGGASGPTRGIGYDDGHQTRAAISEDWSAHPQLSRILEASGVIGEGPCAAYRATHRDIVTPYGMAYEVFEERTLPKYVAVSERAFRKGWGGLPPIAQGVLTATVYNRGASMAGERRREMRVMRDDCVPRADLSCMADQLRSMCRLFKGTPNEAGLCGRYNDAARLLIN